MRPTAAKYACTRIDQIASQQIKDLEDANRIPMTSSKELYDMIKDGTVQLKKKAPKNNRYGNAYHDSISEYFNLENIAKVNTFEEWHQEQVEEIHKTVNEIKDEIWLGDEARAMKLLEEFQGE